MHFQLALNLYNHRGTPQLKILFWPDLIMLCIKKLEVRIPAFSGGAMCFVNGLDPPSHAIAP